MTTQPTLFDPSRQCRAEAHASVDKETWRRNVLEYIGKQGDRGATADEVAQHFGVPANTVAPRICELKAGLIVANGLRRLTRSGCSAAVYVRVSR